MAMKKRVVLCDFDGTITDIDTAEFVLDIFAQGDWRAIEALFEKGGITLEECLRRQFSLVKVSKKQILNVLESVATLRPDFEEFARYCKNKGIPLVIVSAGLDFVIKHFLEVKNLKNLATVYMPKTEVTTNGIEFKFPRRYYKTSVNFKHDLVKRYKSQGFRVISVGDGSADFPVAKEASLALAIEGSTLEKLCKKEKIPCKSVSSFLEVLEWIRKM
jgi:2-hydroxy-3-keto-5-methylthiopentenyl-1-phosphate phosphatase